jgi:hypothetical protein
LILIWKPFIVLLKISSTCKSNYINKKMLSFQLLLMSF